MFSCVHKGVGRKFSRGANETPKISKKYRKIALFSLFQGVGIMEKRLKNSKKNAENSIFKPLSTIFVACLKIQKCRGMKIYTMYENPARCVYRIGLVIRFKICFGLGLYFVSRKKIKKLSRSDSLQAKLSYYLPFFISFISSHSSTVIYALPAWKSTYSTCLNKLNKNCKAIFKNSNSKRLKTVKT